jgi:hypothetical protein
MSVLEALAAARAAGVKLILDNGDVYAETTALPADVVALLQAAKPD